MLTGMRFPLCGHRAPHPEGGIGVSSSELFTLVGSIGYMWVQCEQCSLAGWRGVISPVGDRGTIKFVQGVGGKQRCWVVMVEYEVGEV